jgi:TRAP transporter TAXI family solute receptor
MRQEFNQEVFGMKIRTFGTMAAAIAAVGLVAAGPAQAEMKRINIGSNPAGSVYFLLAGGFAKLFQKELKIRSNAQPHAGSSVYLPLMDKGEIVLGLNSSLDSGMAFNGKAPFRERHLGVKSIARVWILPYGYMTKESSGIKTVSDLKGKRVVINFKTNVSLGELNRTILSTAGIRPSDVIELESGGVVAGINMVVEGRADAVTVAMTMPAMRQAHSTVPGGLRMVALPESATDEEMARGMPGSRTFVAEPNKRLGFVRGTTKIAAFDSFLNAGTTVADEDAYKLARTLHANWKQLQKDYPPLRGTPQEGLSPATNPMPYHAGAIKYWREVGLWTAANDKQQGSLK